MKAQVITEQGLKTLGRVLKEARTKKGLTMQKLVYLIAQKNGRTVCQKYICDLERGYVDHPGWDKIDTIAATGYVINSETGQPYKTHELFHIACEQIDPTLNSK